MANVFKPKRSSTASSVPTTSDLADGELAVNSSDQKIYLRDGASIVEVGNVASGGISNVVEDTTPQLGGTLDINGNLIQFGDSSGATDDKLQFGASQDLEIYHNGFDSYIDNSTGILYIRNNVDADVGGDIRIEAKSGEPSIVCQDDSEVAIYYDGTPKFYTVSTGIYVSGNITVTGTVDGRDVATDGTKLDGIASGAIADIVSDTTPQLGGTLDTNGNLIDFGDSGSATDDRLRFGQGNDLQIWHNGADSYISQQGTGNLTIGNTTDDQDVIITTDDGSGSTAVYFRADGSTGDAILYHYGSEKIKTQSGGIDVTGHTETDTLNVSGISTFQGNVELGDSVILKLGDNGDLQLRHAGTTSEIRQTQSGTLRITNSGTTKITNSTGLQDRAIFNATSVELFYDDVKKFETTTNGVSITGSVTATSFVKSGGTSSQFLMADGTTSTGGGGISNVVEDTTPQLGGTLDTNGNVIDFGDCASFNDSDSGDDRLRFGASNDLQIYHVANSNSYIDNRSQHLYIRNAGTNDDSNIYIQAVDGENSIICLDDSSVNLYCDNSLKLQTVSGGVDVTGTLTATSIVKSGGTSSQFLMADGSVSTGGGGISNIVEDTTPQLGGTLDTNGNLIQIGDSSSATDDRLQIGTGQDLQLWHNGSNSYISQQSVIGDLYLLSTNDDNDIIIQTDNGSGGVADYFRADGSTGEAILYHYGTAKLSTKSTGIDVSGTITGADSVASSANGLRKITASTSSPSGGSDGDIWIKYTA